MKIGSCEAKRGRLTFGKLSISKSYQMPVAVMQGKPGKTCFISGGMHGNEINGPRLVQRVMHSIKPKELTGTIVFLPLLNVSGYHARQRRVQEDKKDLNRSFPGSTKNTSEKIAKEIFALADQCDFGIDCHDAGTTQALIPHPRVHINKKGICKDGCTLEMGRMLQTEILLLREGSAGMLAVEIFKRLQKPVLTFEVGGGMLIWKKYQKEAEEGIKNLLRYEGMLPGKVKTPRKQYVIKDDERFTYKAKIEGLLTKEVELGNQVHKGDLIGIIHDPIDEKTQTIKAKHCGVVFSLKVVDKIDKDEPICSILQTKTCKGHHTKPSKNVEQI